MSFVSSHSAIQTTSLLTIGYGDVVVNNQGIDRLLDSVLIVLGLVAVTIWASCASRALDTYRSRRAEGSRRECTLLLLLLLLLLHPVITPLPARDR